MKVAFNELSGVELCLKIKDDGWFPRDGITAGKEIEGTVTVRRTGELEAEVSGAITVSVLASCDRCAGSLQIPLECEFAYECVVGSEEHGAQQESECKEEDFNRIYLKESVIDIGEILREQILLSMPLRNLCDESCRGLCPECGVNLNDETCNCERTEKPSPFSILQKIKGR